MLLEGDRRTRGAAGCLDVLREACGALRLRALQREGIDAAVNAGQVAALVVRLTFFHDELLLSGTDECGCWRLFCYGMCSAQQAAMPRLKWHNLRVP